MSRYKLMHISLWWGRGREGGVRSSRNMQPYSFQQWVQMQVRPPWTFHLDLLCWQWTGSGHAPPLDTRTLLALDTKQTLSILTNSCHGLRGKPFKGHKSCVNGASPWHDLNTDWFFWSVCRGRRGPCLVKVAGGWGRGGSTYLPYTMWCKGMWYKGRVKSLLSLHCT